MTSPQDTELEIYVIIIKKSSTTGLPYHSNMYTTRWEKLPLRLKEELGPLLELRTPMLIKNLNEDCIGVFAKDYSSIYSASIGFIACMLAHDIKGDNLNESKSRF